jgi:outer membrane murein-binding lipoprotein Lpp
MMPILTTAGKWLAGLFLALCLSGLIYGLWQRSEVSRLSAYAQALENRVAGLQASEKALRASAEAANRARKAAQTRADAATKELQDAYKANPDWAAQPVPDGVWRALGVEPYPTP